MPTISEVLDIEEYVDIFLKPVRVHRFVFPDVTVQFNLTEGVRFECVGCGNCCHTDVPCPITNREKKTLWKNRKEYPFLTRKSFVKGEIVGEGLPSSHSGFRIATSPAKRVIANAEWKIKCAFLSNKNRCKIYRDRPVACKLYPFRVIEKTLIDFFRAWRKNENDLPPVIVQFYYEGENEEYVCNGYHVGNTNRDELRTLSLLMRKYIMDNIINQVAVAQRMIRHSMKQAVDGVEEAVGGKESVDPEWAFDLYEELLRQEVQKVFKTEELKAKLEEKKKALKS